MLIAELIYFTFKHTICFLVELFHGSFESSSEHDARRDPILSFDIIKRLQIRLGNIIG